MNVTIVYDSVFGNTAAIAKEMAAALVEGHTVRLLPVGEAGGLPRGRSTCSSWWVCS